MSLNFYKFSLPSKTEGFDEIKYEWDNESKAKAYLTEWQKEQKLTCRVEDLQPGEWFKTKSAEWAKVIKEWQAKQKSVAKPAPKAKEAKESEEKEGEEDDDMAPDVDIFSVDNVEDIGDGVPLFKDFTFEDWVMT